ncbi:uncharacterized protein J4E79_009536 [Alternaria viburni]|uniref:uncharacterized protein n=1 Tax=Alternaria viburni TaxID=566460 RepID=UPI0020C581AC|nr:uncharacterized protein J4E79_009536 [Alternaria viburni]KAI4650268.1 hypothetical protein J4E79_009536 [Alternaria viburni]
MYSSLLRSASPNVRIDDEVWDMIFPAAKSKKNKLKTREIAQSTDPITAKHIDIRDWPFTDRRMLVSKYNRIKIFVDDEFITTISKPLFRATSTKTSEILANGTIVLPAAVDADAIHQLIDYLESVVSEITPPLPFPLSLPIIVSLSTCAAAAALGTDKYIHHLYAECEDLLQTSLRTRLPTYATMDVITASKTTQPYSRLFRILSTNLAIRVRNETFPPHRREGSRINVIPNPEDFCKYCKKNPVLVHAIRMANEKYSTLESRKDKNDPLRDGHVDYDRWYEGGFEKKLDDVYDEPIEFWTRCMRKYGRFGDY